MKKVKLTFQTSEQLLAFCTAAKISNFQIEMPDPVLVCTCSEKDVDVAKTSYQATVGEVGEWQRFL